MQFVKTAAVTFGAAVLLGVSLVLPGDLTPRPAADAVPVASDEAAPIVEDFDYPGADKILQEQGVVLKRGDGHIVLATCDSQEGLLEVWARSKAKICFRVTGAKGYLSLEIPSVYGVKGNAYQAEVNMTVNGAEKSFDIPEDTWTPVGESADADSGEHMLVEINTSK